MRPGATTRERLRTETRDQHDRLDAAFSGLDLDRPGGLAVFLAAQDAALSALTCEAGPDRPAAEALLAEMRGALSADLGTLGAGRPVLPPPLTADATAVLYILLGSRLGTQVIARRWREAAQGSARQAGRYLTLDPRKDAWRAFLHRHGTAGDAGADRLVAHARRLFDHFAAALTLNTPHDLPEPADA